MDRSWYIPKPAVSLETYAIDQLKEYKQQVESGAKKFETLASLNTDDPGSKGTGGKYDINKMKSNGILYSLPKPSA